MGQHGIKGANIDGAHNCAPLVGRWDRSGTRQFKQGEGFPWDSIPRPETTSIFVLSNNSYLALHSGAFLFWVFTSICMLVAHCTMKNVLWLFGCFYSKLKASVIYVIYNVIYVIRNKYIHNWS